MKSKSKIWENNIKKNRFGGKNGFPKENMFVRQRIILTK